MDCERIDPDRRTYSQRVYMARIRPIKIPSCDANTIAATQPQECNNAGTYTEAHDFRKSKHTNIIVIIKIFV